MCRWFKKYEGKVEFIDNLNNYKTTKDGDVEIKVEIVDKNHWIVDKNRWIGAYKKDIIILKSLIISHTKNSIIFKDYRYYYNFEYTYCYIGTCKDISKSIELKENFIKYKETQIKTYEYFKEDDCWKLTNTSVVGTETEYEQTPLEVFKDEYKSKYKLIETEEEFNEYMSSSLDCNTWCRKKLYNKMKELGLGDGFINQFADLVGNNLDKYHAMIDLANEVTDKDTLMYLYTYKFGENKGFESGLI